MKKSRVAVRTNFAAAGLLAVMVVTGIYVVRAITAVGVLRGLRDGTVSMPEFDSFYAGFDRLEEIQNGCWGVAALLFAFWMPAALRGARELGAQGLRFRYGWPWFLLPIANLFIPYQAMKELWQASHATPEQAHGWHRRPVFSWLPTWWALWVASYLLGVGLEVVGTPFTLDDSIRMTYGAIAHSVAGFFFMLLTFVVIRRIGAAQAARTADGMPAARIVS